jgi:hypothetical protein
VNALGAPSTGGEAAGVVPGVVAAVVAVLVAVPVLAVVALGGEAAVTVTVVELVDPPHAPTNRHDEPTSTNRLAILRIDVERMFARRRISEQASRTLLLATATATAAAALAIAPTTAPACGCGVLLRASEVSEKAVVSYRHRVETIVPGLEITRVGPQAAVLFPVPGRPRVRALAAGLDVFGELEAATTPKPPTESAGPGGGFGAAAPRPTVVSRQQLGGYEVTVLKGGSGQTLLAWLHSHRYDLPTGSQPILAHYIGRRWYFVALRLADRRAGVIRPLAIAFRSRLIVYPMLLSRLASHPISVELFVDATGPGTAGQADGLFTAFTGRVSTLSPAPSSAVRALLPAPYLTRMDSTAVNPAAISRDVIVKLRPAAARPKSSGHPLRIIAGVVAALVVLGGVWAVLRRRRPAAS